MLKIIMEDPINTAFFSKTPSSFLRTLFKALLNAQDAIRLDSLEYLHKYLKYLFDLQGILPFYQHSIEFFTAEKTALNLDKTHINLSSIAEENASSMNYSLNFANSSNFARKNSEDFGFNFFEDSIISSPGFEEKKLEEKFIEKHDEILEEKLNLIEKLEEKPSVFSPINEEIWFEILFNLKEKTKDSSVKVRDSSLEVLFSLLLSFGYTFSVEFWGKINKEILRVCFEEILRNFLCLLSLDTNCLRVLLIKAFNNLAKLVGLYIKENEGLLQEFLEIVRTFSQMRNEFLAKLSLSTLRSILAYSSKKFSKNSRGIIVKFIEEICEDSTPNSLMDRENLELFFPKSSSDLMKGFGSCEAVFRPVNLRFNIKDCLTKCVVQLLVINITKEFVERNVGFLSNEVISQIYLQDSS